MAEARVYSLQARLAVRLAAIFVAGALIVTGGLVWKAVTSFGSLRDRSLQAQASDVARMIVLRPNGTVALEPDATLLTTYRRWGEGYLFAIYAADGDIALVSSAAAKAVFADHLPDDPEIRFFQIVAPEDRRFDGYVTRKDGFTILVAQGDLHDDVLADSLIREFIGESAIWLVPVVLLALLVGVQTIRKSLEPLQELSAEAARIAPSRTEIRLSASDLPREVEPMVRAINQALGRLDDGFVLQRRFTADAAHELRTPLAVLTARIDGLDASATRTALLKDVARINRVTDQLLDAARLNACPLDLSKPLDLHAAAIEAISAVAPRAVQDRRDLELTGGAGPVWVQAAPAAAHAAIVNLLDNALKHTPAGSPITVLIEQNGTLGVIDRGPGIPADQRASVFRRFWRGAEQGPETGQSDCPPGAGLGLSIVAEAMRAMGGTVDVENGDDGGARFRLKFRPATAPAAATAAKSA